MIYSGNRDLTRRAALDLVYVPGTKELRAPGGGGSFPGIRNVKEETARAMLSIASGVADGIEDAAAICRFDARLAEGLVLVAAARARDTDLVGLARLRASPGFARLCQWLAIPVSGGAALVAIAKRDISALVPTLTDIGLADIDPEIFSAMINCTVVANPRAYDTFGTGTARLAKVMGKLATLYNVKDRQAGQVAAVIIRLAQGDASPLKNFALRLGIGRRDVPFLGAISMLGHSAPCDVEEGDCQEWLARRHAHTATRRFSYTMGLDEKTAWVLVQAGRGRPRGLNGVRITLLNTLKIFDPGLMEEQSAIVATEVGDGSPSSLMTQDGVFTLITYIIESFGTGKAGPDPLAYAETLDSAKDVLLIAFFEKFANDIENYRASTMADDPGLTVEEIGGAHAETLMHHTSSVALTLLKTLANMNGANLPVHCAFFLLALPTPSAARAVGSIVSHYLGRQDTKNELTPRDFGQCVRVVLALAHGDERALKRAAYSAVILQKINFRVRSTTSAAAVVDEPSSASSTQGDLPPAPDGETNGAPTYGGALTEDHPIIFLLRFACRRPSCFDIMPPGARARGGQTATIAEKRLCSDVAALKGLFMVIAHRWDELVSPRKDEPGQLSYLSALVSKAELGAAAAQTLVGVAMRGAKTKDNELCEPNASRLHARLVTHSRTSIDGSPEGILGIPEGALLAEIAVIVDAIGGKAGLIGKAFMSGASEDKMFLRENLAPLCNALKLEMDVALELIGTMQYDQTAAISLSLRALGTNVTEMSEIKLIKESSTTPKKRLSESFKTLSVKTLSGKRLSAKRNSAVDKNSQSVEEADIVLNQWLTGFDKCADSLQISGDDALDESTDANKKEDRDRFAKRVLTRAESLEATAIILMVSLIDVLLVPLWLLGVIDNETSSFLGYICSLLFAVDVSFRTFGHFLKADLRSFCASRFTQIDVFVVLVDVVSIAISSIPSLSHIRSVGYIRVVRGPVRLLRVAINLSAPREVEEKGVTIAPGPIKCFLALARINDPAYTWSEWEDEREVLGRVLFGTTLYTEDLVRQNPVGHAEKMDLVRRAVHASRCDLAEFNRVLELVPGTASASKEHLTDLKDLAKLWNRSMTVFFASGGPSPVERLGQIFTERVVKSREGGGFSLFFGSTNGMLTFVCEQLTRLAMAAQKPNSRFIIGYPPFMPRIMLAVRRDNVLISNASGVHVKPDFDRPLENLLLALIGK